MLSLFIVSEISRDVTSTSSSNDSSRELRRSLSSEIKSSIKGPHRTKARDQVVELAAGDEDYNDVFQYNEHVRDRLKAVKWSSAAIKRLKELTLDGEQRIASLKYDEIKKQLPDEPTPIYLHNTNEDVVVFINKVLVDEALAASNVLSKTSEEKAVNQGRGDVILHMITSYYTTLNYTTLHNFTLHYATSHNITSHHTKAHHIISHQVTLHYTISHQITSH